MDVLNIVFIFNSLQAPLKDIYQEKLIFLQKNFANADRDQLLKSGIASALRLLKTCSMKDIETIDDIRAFVDHFYDKVREDALLAPVFDSKIPAEAWPAHLQRMYAFWNAILFAEKGFDGNPMRKHLSLPIDEAHFSQWLFLFYQTIDELFAGEKAEEAKKRAFSIAQIMNFKISTLRS